MYVQSLFCTSLPHVQTKIIFEMGFQFDFMPANLSEMCFTSTSYCSFIFSFKLYDAEQPKKTTESSKIVQKFQ